MDILLIILLVFAFLMLATVLFPQKKKVWSIQALATEYFFKRPDLLQTKHPELYNILSTIFRQKPEKV
jgi:hypothetical protein